MVRACNSHQNLVDAGQNLSETLTMFAAGVVGLDTVTHAQAIWSAALAEAENDHNIFMWRNPAKTPINSPDAHGKNRT